MKVICDHAHDCYYPGACYHKIEHLHHESCVLRLCMMHTKCHDVIKVERKIKINKLNKKII